MRHRPFGIAVAIQCLAEVKSLVEILRGRRSCQPANRLTRTATRRAISFGPRAIGRATRAETACSADPVAGTGPERGSCGTSQPRAPDHASDPAVAPCPHPNLGAVRNDRSPSRRGLRGCRRRDRARPPASLTTIRSKGGPRAIQLSVDHVMFCMNESTTKPVRSRCSPYGSATARRAPIVSAAS
jgi:hypothetical protein